MTSAERSDRAFVARMNALADGLIVALAVACIAAVAFGWVS